MAEITPDDLSARLEADDDEVFVLDIRHESDYEDWHIPGSTNIDVYDQLKEEPETATDALSEIPDDTEVVTGCAAGVVSDTATDQLRTRGYEAKTLVDGMNGWSRVHRSAPVEVGIEGTLVQVTRPGEGCLSYVLVSDGEATVIDPSQYSEEYEATLEGYDADLGGVYRMWRDAGYAFGAILIGVTADLASIQAAFYVTAIAMFLSGGVVAAWMRETHPTRGNYTPPTTAIETERATRDD